MTLAMPPTPPSWQSLLLPAGISAALILLVIYAVFARLARLTASVLGSKFNIRAARNGREALCVAIRHVHR